MPISEQLKSRCKVELSNLTDRVGNYLDLLKIKHELLDEHGKEIDALKRRLEGMFGSVNYLGVYDFGSATPDQSALYERAKILTENPTYTPSKGDTIVNSFDSSDWYFNGNKWISLGISAVGLATNSIPGIILGSEEVFGISVDDEGHLQVNGLVEVLGMIQKGMSDINEILVAEYIADYGVASVYPQIKTHLQNDTDLLLNVKELDSKRFRTNENPPASGAATPSTALPMITMKLQVKQVTPYGSLVTWDGYLAGTMPSRRPIGANITPGSTPVNGIIEVCVFGICDVLVQCNQASGTAITTTIDGGQYFTINTYGVITAAHVTTVNTSNYSFITMERFSYTSAATEAASQKPMKVLIR